MQASQDIETKACKRVIFLQNLHKLKFKPTTVRTLTDIDLNVKGLEQSACGLQTVALRKDGRAALGQASA